jgi:hypothetical protein
MRRVPVASDVRRQNLEPPLARDLDYATMAEYPHLFSDEMDLKNREKRREALVAAVSGVINLTNALVYFDRRERTKCFEQVEMAWGHHYDSKERLSEFRIQGKDE